MTGARSGDESLFLMPRDTQTFSVFTGGHLIKNVSQPGDGVYSLCQGS